MHLLLMGFSLAAHPVLCEALQDEGYDIAHVSTVDEAQAVLDQPGIDVDLVLIRWPADHDRWLDLLTAIRARFDQHYIPFLLWLDTEEHATSEQALRVGADDYVLSSASPATILNRLQTSTRIMHLENNLRQAREQVQYQSRYDQLTGLLNRWALSDTMTLELNHSRRKQRPLSLLLLRIRDMRHINEQHGFQVGDQVMEQVAQMLALNKRTYDQIGRWEGADFVVLLPKTGQSEALRVAERVQMLMTTVGLALPNGETLHVQHSMGVVTTDVHRPSMLDELLQQAYAATFTDPFHTAEEVDAFHELARLDPTTTALVSPLRWLHNFMERVTDALPVGLYVYDIHTQQQVYANRHLTEMLGYNYEEMREYAVFIVRALHPDSVALMGKHLQALTVATDDSFRDIEYQAQTADGSWIWLLCRDMIFERDIDGAPRQIMGIAQDITTRKKSEQALSRERAQLSERVAESTAELRRTNHELKQALHTKDSFLAMMSHELRTPLNAVLGLTEALREEVYGTLNDQQHDKLETIQYSGQNLLTIINDILDLAKISAGQVELDIQPISVEMLCTSCLHQVKHTVRLKDIRTTLRIDSMAITVNADPVRFKQVLFNMLENAVKFTSQGGEVGVDVLADRTHSRMHFSIWDTGIGIKEGDIQRLFEPFVQLDNTLARQYEGTGLGLTLVAQLVELHGGSVAVESTYGEGSRFTASLPWAGPPTEGESAADPDAVGIEESSVSRKDHAHILLADDHEMTIKMMENYLTRIGYNVTVARNGHEALHLVHDLQPDIVLMDIQMPELDGLSAITQIRANPDLRHVFVVALTALAMPGDRERCLQAGADEYMSKPVSFRLLRELIDNHTLPPEQRHP